MAVGTTPHTHHSLSGPTEQEVFAGLPTLGTPRISPQAPHTHVLVRPSGWRLTHHSGRERPGPGGTRGVIRGLSSASARRLRDTLLGVDYRTTYLSLVTLTYHDSWTPAPEDWHGDLDAFLLALERAFPGAYLGCLWTLEFQKRGAPHFHILVAWTTPLPEQHTRQVVSTLWTRIVEPGDVAHLRHGTMLCPVSLMEQGGVKRLVGYLTTYLGKREQKLPVDRETGECRPTGRMWGVRGAFPVAVLASWAMRPDAAAQLLRRIRRWGRGSAYLSRFGIRYYGGTIYGTPDSLSFLLRGLRVAELEPDDTS